MEKNTEYIVDPDKTLSREEVFETEKKSVTNELLLMLSMFKLRAVQKNIDSEQNNASDSEGTMSGTKTDPSANSDEDRKKRIFVSD